MWKKPSVRRRLFLFVDAALLVRVRDTRLGVFT